jgi:hypothetical protein
MLTADRTLELIEHALAGVRRGWSVLALHTPRGAGCSCGRKPCPSPGKHPRIAWHELTQRRACAAEVARWWGAWPEANLGVVTGEISSVLVLDVDPRNGGDETLAALESLHGRLPRTWTSATGGGGRHYWFGSATPMATAPLGAGLDRKAEGGMVVVPPSVHASGPLYRWEEGLGPDDLPVAAAPGWVLEPGGAVGAGAAGIPDTPPRTAAEQEAFAEAWHSAGIDLMTGDRYYVCPFHQDHRPSLHIDAEGCRWYCFGCAAGGGTGMLRRRLGESGARRGRARLTGSVGRSRPVTLFGSRETPIVGESHHQDALLELSGGARRYGGVDLDAVAELTPDPANR